MQNKKLSFGLALTWFIITIILLTLPGSAFPKEDWLSKIWFDKWVHIGLFSLWVLLWCLYARNIFPPQNRRQVFIRIAIAGILYGIAMEYVQKYWIPNRSFDTGDIIADAVGCLMGLGWCLGRYIKK